MNSDDWREPSFRLNPRDARNIDRIRGVMATRRCTLSLAATVEMALGLAATLLEAGEDGPYHAPPPPSLVPPPGDQEAIMRFLAKVPRTPRPEPKRRPRRG